MRERIEADIIRCDGSPYIHIVGRPHNNCEEKEVILDGARFPKGWRSDHEKHYCPKCWEVQRGIKEQDDYRKEQAQRAMLLDMKRSARLNFSAPFTNP